MSYGNSYGGNNPYGGSNPYQQGPSAEGGYGYDQVRRNKTRQFNSLIRFNLIRRSVSTNIDDDAAGT